MEFCCKSQKRIYKFKQSTSINEPGTQAFTFVFSVLSTQKFICVLQDVQLKVKTYLLGTDLSNFKYDDFIFVLDVISRYAGVFTRPFSTCPQMSSGEIAQLIKADICILMPMSFKCADSLKSCMSEFMRMYLEEVA